MTDAIPSLHIKQYTVSPELFTLGFAKAGGPYTCNSKCCKGGAYVDPTERDRVLAHADLIQAVLDDSQSQNPDDWFETEIKVDTDYPSGTCVGTGMRNDRCGLQDKRGYCSIQVAATQAGMHKWALKPLYCVLFPVEVISNVIRYDRRFHDVFTSCTALPKFDVPLFESCREEIVHLVGDAGYDAMADHYAKHYAGQAQPAQPAPPNEGAKRLPIYPGE
jgi:hypothetical protein